MSIPDKGKGRSVLRVWRVPLALLGLVGVLHLAARLDPGYRERERASETAQAEREADKARVAALMPEAARAPKDARSIGFTDLAFVAPDGDTPSTGSAGYAAWAPPKVKALDGHKVRIEGFMLPTRMADGGATECLILANQMACCYGRTPGFSEFIVARMQNAPAPVLQDQTLVFTGVLHVGDVFEGKAWTAFYTLDLTDVGRK